MDAIGLNSEDKKFNIVFNKVSKKEKSLIFENPQNIEEIKKQLNLGRHKTASVTFIELDRDIEDGGKELITIDTDLAAFFYGESEKISIISDVVSAIQIDKLEEINRKHEEDISKLRQELKEAQNKPAVHHHHYHQSSSGGGGLCLVQ
jgi:hypothetical protein